MTPLFFFKSLIFFQFLLVSAQDGGCPTSFSCGSLGQITFPFTVTQHPHCGPLAIRGCDYNDTTVPKSIHLGKPRSKQSFNITYLEGNTITVTDNEAHRKNLLSRNCQAFQNFPVPPTSPLASFYIKYNITMFKCNHSLSVTPPKSFQNYTNCSDYDVYYEIQSTASPPGFEVPSSLTQCTQCQVAIRDRSTDDPFEFLSPQISIVVQLSDDCNQCLHHQGGRCQLDIQGKFHCAEGMLSQYMRIVKKSLGEGRLSSTKGYTTKIVKKGYQKIQLLRLFRWTHTKILAPTSVQS